MAYNDYNLRQLLELALRVPEVGAVNFNILYYVLKTIIEKGGLEEVKPNFSLDAFVTGPQCTTESKQKEISIRKSYSAESVTSAKDILTGKDDEDEAKVHKGRLKWDQIKVFKRLEAVEDEISSIHSMLSQLVGKVSNFGKVCELQETRFLKELDYFRKSIESKIEFSEYNILSEKVHDVVSKVSVLMELKKEISELREEFERSDTEDEDIPEKIPKFQLRKSDETVVSETKSSEVPMHGTKRNEIDLDETKLVEEKSEEIKSSDPKTKDSRISDMKTESGKPDEVIKEKEKSSSRKAREQEILSKIGALDKEIISIKEYLKSAISFRAPAEKDAYETVKERTETDDEIAVLDGFPGIENKIQRLENASKQEKNIEKMYLQLLNVSVELRKLMNKCDALDRMFSRDINKIKENTFILEQCSSKYNKDLETIKDDMNGMVHNFEGMKENFTYIEKQIAVLDGFPGIENKIQRLEDYVYSGSEYQYSAKGILSADVDKKTAEDLEEGSFMTVKPTTDKIHRAKEMEKYTGEYDLDDETGKGHTSGRFHILSRNVALLQDMERKRQIQKFKRDFYRPSFIQDIYLHEESKYKSVHETKAFETDDFTGVKKIPSYSESSKRDSDEKIKSSTYTSDLLEEHSHQLRGQVAVYVKKRLHDFEIELQVIEGNITTLKKKTDYLEKCSKELSEKITYMDASFSQRSGDFAALKSMTENHQASIVNIVHHLDRKAEVYAVKQKVSRRELTVIEDRVLKLCKTTSLEISKLEEKMDDSLEKFRCQVDKKLFTEEFELRLEFIFHKLKVFEIKLKDIATERPVTDFEGIRPPIEIKKYVECKAGTKINQDRSAIASWRTKSNNDRVIPLLSQPHVDKEVSPRTAAQIKKRLELASSRESKRYVEGSYTKIKIGKK